MRAESSFSVLALVSYPKSDSAAVKAIPLYISCVLGGIAQQSERFDAASCR